jgi:hypothetical protein
MSLSQAQAEWPSDEQAPQGTPPVVPATVTAEVEPKAVNPQEVEAEAQPKPKKVFSRSDIKKHIEVKVIFPKIYPDYEPWEFHMRLKLSTEAEDRRQEYLSLSASQRMVKVSEQALDEVCDLLVDMPTGFSDLESTGKGPGHSFRSYVETATDPSMKDFLYMLVEAADSAYWGAITPLEFRK